jgi:hypothetical protein
MLLLCFMKGRPTGLSETEVVFVCVYMCVWISISWALITNIWTNFFKYLLSTTWLVFCNSCNYLYITDSLKSLIYFIYNIHSLIFMIVI